MTDEVFMGSVLTHGKLEIVLLCVHSVTAAGITVLIENSPKLCLFKIYCYSVLAKNEHKQLITLKDILKERLLHRKLFNLDGFTITGQVEESYGSSSITT